MLIEALRGLGYQVIGPQIVDGAVVYRELDAAGQLPIGYIDRQDGGTYRLEKACEAVAELTLDGNIAKTVPFRIVQQRSA